MEYQDCGANVVGNSNSSPRESLSPRARSYSLPLISSVNSLDLYMLSPLQFLEDDDECESFLSPSSPTTTNINFPFKPIATENPSLPPTVTSTPNQRMKSLCEKYQTSSLNRRSSHHIPNQPCSLKTLLMDNLQHNVASSSRSNSVISSSTGTSSKHCPFHRHSTSDLFGVNGKYSDASFNYTTIGKHSSTHSEMDDMESCTESEMAHMFFYFVVGIVMVIVEFAKKCMTITEKTCSCCSSPLLVDDLVDQQPPCSSCCQK